MLPRCYCLCQFQHDYNLISEKCRKGKGVPKWNGSRSTCTFEVKLCKLSQRWSTRTLGHQAFASLCHHGILKANFEYLLRMYSLLSGVRPSYLVRGRHSLYIKNLEKDEASKCVCHTPDYGLAHRDQRAKRGPEEGYGQPRPVPPRRKEGARQEGRPRSPLGFLHPEGIRNNW